MVFGSRIRPSAARRTASGTASEEPDANADRIRSALSGNLCRCTSYIPIVEVVLEARGSNRKADKP